MSRKHKSLSEVQNPSTNEEGDVMVINKTENAEVVNPETTNSNGDGKPKQRGRKPKIDIDKLRNITPFLQQSLQVAGEAKATKLRDRVQKTLDIVNRVVTKTLAHRQEVEAARKVRLIEQIKGLPKEELAKLLEMASAGT
jgi:hypothetical protein